MNSSGVICVAMLVFRSRDTNACTAEDTSGRSVRSQATPRRRASSLLGPADWGNLPKPQPHHNGGVFRRLPGDLRRQPPDPLRHRILSGARLSGPPCARVPGAGLHRRGGGSFPHAIGDSLIGFIEQSSKFLKPVFAGDPLYPALTVSGLIPQRSTGVVVMDATLHNQTAELVMTGEHKYLLRL